MKRENNTGTITKLKGSRRNPYIAKFPNGFDENDNRKWITVGYFRTKSDASLALSKHIVQPISERHNIKLSEIFNEWKLTKYKDLSKSSIDMYDNAYKHLSSLFNLTFVTLRVVHFQNIIDNLDLSRSSLNKIKILAGQLYDYAVFNDICNKNYAKGIKLQKETKTIKKIFSNLEIKILFKNDSIAWVDSIIFLIYTGFRIQEMLSITKFNVDLTRQVITGGLKTDAGIDRIIPIHPKIMGYIKSRYNNCDTYLFEGVKGTQITQNHYRRKIYYSLLSNLKIEQKTPHSTRHTFATLLSNSNVDTLAIQKILGHTNYAFTADVYTHSDISFLQNELLKLK